MKKLIIFCAAVVVIALILFSSTYVVYEDEVAVVKTFGKIVSVVINQEDEAIVANNISKISKGSEIKVITAKGLQFKLPFAQTVDVYTSKNLTYQSQVEIINTQDDKKIEISMYAQYRIIDPLKFQLTINTLENVRAKMDNRVYPVVIQSANNLAFHEFFELDLLNELVTEKRNELNEELINDFGIYVTDIGINKKNFPASNITAIEEKMSMQIEKESQKLKAEGDSIYEQAKAKTDRQRIEVVSAAREEAANTKASADAEALTIYQNSLQKDLEFYKFIQRMNIYKSLTDTTVFLDQNNEFISQINGY